MDVVTGAVQVWIVDTLVALLSLGSLDLGSQLPLERPEDQEEAS